MSNNRDDLENQLRAESEEAIRKLLDELPDKSDLTITDIEHFVGRMGHEVMQGLMQSIANDQQATPTEVICEHCQMKMHKRGKRKKQVVTKRGEIELERQYYVCPHCGHGAFPPR